MSKYNEKVKIRNGGYTPNTRVDDTVVDQNSLDGLVKNLVRLRFEKADTINLDGYKTQGILRYGLRFNDIIIELLNIKHGNGINKSKIVELEERVDGLSYAVSNDTFLGDVSYDNKSVGYFILFPKIAEFLKKEVKKLKQESNLYADFSEKLKKVGVKGEFNAAGCNKFADYVLSEYNRVMQELIKFEAKPDEVDLNKFYDEEIPMIQGFVKKNKNKISGDIFYNNKKGSIIEFTVKFGRYLMKRIRNLDKDIGEREQISLDEEDYDGRKSNLRENVKMSVENIGIEGISSGELLTGRIKQGYTEVRVPLSGKKEEKKKESKHWSQDRRAWDYEG